MSPIVSGRAPSLHADAGETDPAGLLIAAAIGAVASLLITEYSFGIQNNYFHLPILERLYDEPQFRTDAFIQSLRYFAAGPFLLLEGSAKYIAPELLFPLLNYLSRLLSFVGLLLCARQLGVTSRRARLLFVVLTSFTQILRGSSYAGQGGLFIEYFAHSEIANGFLLISLYYATTGRLALAFLVNGLVFFTNAFMGVWNAIPLGIVILLLLRDGRMTMPEVLRRGALGLIGFALCAAPVVWNIVSNPAFGQPIGIDYRVFLAEYWPYHFIFGPNPLKEKVYLAGVVASGMAAFAAIGRSGRMLQGAFWGFVALYCIGIVVPWITASPLVLNLHLLRSSAALHLLAGLVLVSLTTTWLLGEDIGRAKVWGPLLALLLCTLRGFILATPFVIGLAFLPQVTGRIPAILLRKRGLVLTATAAVLALVWSYQAVRAARAKSTNDATAQVWREVGQWAYTSTDPEAMFMVPTSQLTEDVDRDKLEQGEEIFQFVSHRRVWVSGRSGAAVMWSPSFYSLWHDRMRQQVALPDVAAKLAFAADHGIDFVVDHCRAAQVAPVYASKDVCVYPSGAISRSAAIKG